MQIICKGAGADYINTTYNRTSLVSTYFFETADYIIAGYVES